MMRRLLFGFIVLLLCLPAYASGLQVGDKAPLFEAASTQGIIRLADFSGKKNVVLAFYFKDFTPV